MHKRQNIPPVIGVAIINAKWKKKVKSEILTLKTLHLTKKKQGQFEREEKQRKNGGVERKGKGILEKRKGE